MKALIEFLINNPQYMKDLDRIQINRFKILNRFILKQGKLKRPKDPKYNAWVSPNVLYAEPCAYIAMASYFQEEWMTRNPSTETVGGYAFDRALARLDADTDDLLDLEIL